MRYLLNTQNLHHYKGYYQKLLNGVMRIVTKLKTAPRSHNEWMRLWGSIQLRDIPRILIVAPSNHAVDNITRRVMELGFTSFQTGRMANWKPRIVRVGSDSKDPLVRLVSLRSQAERLINMSTEDLQRELSVVRKTRVEIEQALVLELSKLWKDPTLRGRVDIGNRICTMNDDLLVHKGLEGRLTQVIQVHTGQLGSQGRGGNARRRNNKGGARMSRGQLQRILEESIVGGAQLVCTTLSSSALHVLNKHMSDGVNFEVCIVDEAGQATEPDTLIPLQHRCKHVVLCGDPKQLPATVKSRSAKDRMYHRSLFERLSLTGHPVHFLDSQFRCHPEIYRFPSDAFYGGRVVNGERNIAKFEKPWHRYLALRPLVFFDIGEGFGMSGEERSSSTRSLRNMSEATFVVSLLKSLGEQLRQDVAAGFAMPSALDALLRRVAVLTPYRDQVGAIRDTMRQRLPGLENGAAGGSGSGGGRKRKRGGGGGGAQHREADATDIVQSVDKFQGQERDVVVLSTVRAEGLGFVRDVQRMCVALTRGKYSLLIVGNRRNLSRGSKVWRNFFKYLDSLDRIIIVRDLQMDPLEDFGEVGGGSMVDDDDLGYTRNI